ncbi:MAG: hypothetical protein KBG58_00160, partial [Giesbergeria sp.]|nr:hypothetical protein [Giesbergeria sp.]
MSKSTTHSSRFVEVPKEKFLKTARSPAAVFAALVSLLASGNSVSKSLSVRFSQWAFLSGDICSKSIARIGWLAKKLSFS